MGVPAQPDVEEGWLAAMGQTGHMRCRALQDTGLLAWLQHRLLSTGCSAPLVLPLPGCSTDRPEPA